MEEYERLASDVGNLILLHVLFYCNRLLWEWEKRVRNPTLYTTLVSYVVLFVINCYENQKPIEEYKRLASDVGNLILIHMLFYCNRLLWEWEKRVRNPTLYTTLVSYVVLFEINCYENQKPIEEYKHLASDVGNLILIHMLFYCNRFLWEWEKKSQKPHFVHYSCFICCIICD